MSGTTAEIVVGIEGLQIGRKAPSGAFTAAVTDALGSMVLDGNTLVGVPEAFAVGASPAAGSMQHHAYAGLESLPGTPYQLARARVLGLQAGVEHAQALFPASAPLVTGLVGLTRGARRF